jgi:hypothetical protein
VPVWEVVSARGKGDRVEKPRLDEGFLVTNGDLPDWFWDIRAIATKKTSPNLTQAQGMFFKLTVLKGLPHGGVCLV